MFEAVKAKKTFPAQLTNKTVKPIMIDDGIGTKDASVDPKI